MRPRSPESDRARQIAAMGRELLDAEGPDGLSMRRLAERIGVTAPALYRYFPDKSALEDAIVAQAHWELGDLCADHTAAARVEGRDELLALAGAYTDWARRHPHLYRLVYCSPQERSRRDPGAEQHGAAQLRALCGGDREAAAGLWTFVHGLVMLELDGRMTDGMQTGRILERGIGLLRPATP